MSINHKTTHEAEVPDLLIEVLRDKPNLLAFINTYVGRVQELEDAIWDVYIGRFLDNAVGVQLDGLGEIVGAPRAGRDDETYRVRLRVQIRLNYGSGRGEDIIASFQLVLQSSTQFLTLREGYPAQVTLDLRAEFNQSVIDELLEILGEAKGAAIRAQLRYYLQPISRTFRFSTSAAPTLNSSRGFTTDPTPSAFVVLTDLTAQFGANTATTFAKGSTRIVAASSQGQLSYSDDEGVSWTAAVSPFSADYLRVFFFGGLFVGVGGGEQIGTSINGASWSIVDSALTAYNGALYNADATYKYVAFGSGASVGIRYSADGTTWVAATSPFGVNGANCGVISNGVYIVAGDSGTLATSSDGQTWVTVTSTFGATAIRGIAADGSGKVVIVGDAGKLATSVNNGASFTLHTSGFGATNIIGVMHGTPGFVAFGESGKLSFSAAGLTWALQTIGFGTHIVSSGVYDTDDALFLIDGETGDAAKSSDGATWTAIDVNTGGDAVGIFYESGVIFAVGDSGFSTTRAVGGVSGGQLAGASEST